MTITLDPRPKPTSERLPINGTFPMRDAQQLATPSTPSPDKALHEFSMNSRLHGANLDLERAKDYPRSIELE
jgi:hypothetical protein